MKRSAPLRRTAFKRKTAHEPAIELEPKPVAKITSLHRGTYIAAGTKADPKPKARRNPALLEMARDMPCLLAIPGVCLGHASQTTVACHSNSQRHGKAGARKADDCYSVWGCMACHRWLDQGPASAEEKERAFELAHEAQRRAWASIADGPFAQMLYAPKFRKAARWALDQINAA